MNYVFLASPLDKKKFCAILGTLEKLGEADRKVRAFAPSSNPR